MSETLPPRWLDRLFFCGAALFLLSTIVWVVYPSGNTWYHLIITGLSKGHVSPFVAKFHPYKDRRVGGSAHAVTLLDDLIASFSGQPFNVVSLGNDLSGSSDAYFTRGQAVIDALNCFHLDALLVGNIDLSFGVNRLSELKKSASFPFLSTNIVEEGRAHPPDFLVSELLLKPDSRFSVGFLGFSPPDTKHLTAAQNTAGLRFLPYAQAIPEKVSRLRQSGATLIVILTLIDKNRLSSQLWESIRVSAPDIVLMLDFDVEPLPPFIRDGILVKTINGYNQGKELDLISLEINPQGRIQRFSGKRLPIFSDELSPNPKTRAIVEESQNRIQKIRSELITVFPFDLQKQYEQGCPIGNLITDAMRFSTGGHLALHNSGAIQSSISSGNFTMGELFNVLPFDNELITMDLSGQAILELLTLSASLKRGVLQISGGNYAFANRSIDDFFLKEVNIASEPLSATRTYRITTNNFLAEGGDEYRPFLEGKNQATGPLVRDILKDYLLAHSATDSRQLSKEVLTIESRVRRE